MKHCNKIQETNKNNYLTTKEFANILAMQSQSIRKRFCKTGSYFGIKPTKLKNGRLLWPSNAIEQLEGEEA